MNWPLKPYDFYTLLVLLRFPMHPYAIRQEMIVICGHKHLPDKASVRRSIDRLVAAGMIKECISTPWPWLKARRGAPYELTKRGRHRLGQEVEMYEEIVFRARYKLKQYDEKIAADPYY